MWYVELLLMAITLLIFYRVIHLHRTIDVTITQNGTLESTYLDDLSIHMMFLFVTITKLIFHILLYALM